MIYKNVVCLTPMVHQLSTSNTELSNNTAEKPFCCYTVREFIFSSVPHILTIHYHSTFHACALNEANSASLSEVRTAATLILMIWNQKVESWGDI
jgi:hypothetical protein